MFNHKNMTSLHDRFAPYWAFLLFMFWLLGLSTVILDLGPFFKGYLLDMVGPAWNYILFRGLFTKKSNNAWTKFFTPTRTYVSFVFLSFFIETLQYFKVYESTFDPLDFLAYISILTPLYILDKLQLKYENSD